MKIKNVEIKGINYFDFPDYMDAYITYAEDESGRELSQEEIKALPDDIVKEEIMGYLF